MLRNKQHSLMPPPWSTAATDGPVTGGWSWPAVTPDGDLRIEVLVEMIDGLDLGCFFLDPAYRRRLSDALARISDEEFDSFERLYTRRFTIN